MKKVRTILLINSLLITTFGVFFFEVYQNTRARVASVLFVVLGLIGIYTWFKLKEKV